MRLISLLLITGIGHSKTSKKLFFFSQPFIFTGYGIHFVLLKYVQENFLTDTLLHEYIISSFFFALLSSTFPLYHYARKERVRFQLRYFTGGVGLAFCNYGSVFFLLQALGIPGAESSSIYATFSVGVVVMSFTAAYFLFEERLRKSQLVGVLAGVAAVILLNQ